MIRLAGKPGGQLTTGGAVLLDPAGRLEPGIAMCPPEGDAGTGMAATSSVAPRTGNVSAGTSIFAMVVLEQELSRVHRELDLVTTPAGDPVAMVHGNNGASELDAWVGLFSEFAAALGTPVEPSRAFETLCTAVLDGAPDGGGLLAYNDLSGEPITELDEGRPMVVRSPDSRLTLATSMRVQLYASLPRFLAAAIDTPVTVGDVAAEGGEWGLAMLAASRTNEQSLVDDLDDGVFAGAALATIEPEPEDTAGFDAFVQRYVAALPVQRTATEHA